MRYRHAGPCGDDLFLVLDALGHLLCQTRFAVCRLSRSPGFVLAADLGLRLGPELRCLFCPEFLSRIRICRSAWSRKYAQDLFSYTLPYVGRPDGWRGSQPGAGNPFRHQGIARRVGQVSGARPLGAATRESEGSVAAANGVGRGRAKLAWSLHNASAFTECDATCENKTFAVCGCEIPDDADRINRTSGRRRVPACLLIRWG